MTDSKITIEKLSAIMAPRIPFYRWRIPIYQLVLLQDLEKIWQGYHESVLDVGGGSGLMAQAIQTLLPVGNVTSIDVVDRFLPNLSIKTGVFDGQCLPFATGSFDAATICNVIHHVPTDIRDRLIADVCRVVRGPIYIKDHVAEAPLDRLRLTILDVIGNLPFGGQISASYLTIPHWHRLASQCNRRIVSMSCGIYRMGLMQALFPNRLEIAFRLD